MAWTTPPTFTAGQVIAASDMNTYVRDDLNFLYGDTIWSGVTMTNGWTSTGASYAAVGKVVFFRGTISPGTANTSAFTLPAGYRPTATMDFAATPGGTATTVVVVSVAAAGTFTPATATAIWLSGISYPTT